MPPTDRSILRTDPTDLPVLRDDIIDHPIHPSIITLSRSPLVPFTLNLRVQYVERLSHFRPFGEDDA